MGLLDRWSKKTTKAQLDETTGKKTEEVETPVKKSIAAKKVATKAAAEKTEKVVNSEVKVSSIADKVLLRPLVTEKAAIAGSHNQYGFIVAKNATKTGIKKAVEGVYGVKPLAVNVINVSGKEVRFGRSLGRRSDYKKALVTLPQGKTINIHEGV
jgi:large subunit ribosomal protein L23